MIGYERTAVHPSILRENRVKAFTRFLADYDAGKRAGRYLMGELPQLEFRNGEFDLALCSHFLFLYSDHFSYEFHRTAVLDMLRIAGEVRIFPLMTLTLKPSPYVAPLIQEVESLGYAAAVHSVPYQFQRGGNQMLRISRRTSLHSGCPTFNARDCLPL